MILKFSLCYLIAPLAIVLCLYYAIKLFRAPFHIPKAWDVEDRELTKAIALIAAIGLIASSCWIVDQAYQNAPPFPFRFQILKENIP